MIIDEITNKIIDDSINGDVDAFETIYQAFSSFVYNVSLRVTNNSEDAREITQDVFVTLHQKLADFRSHSSIKTWIYRITVNKSINLVKKEVNLKERNQKYCDRGDEPKSNNNVLDFINKEHRDTILSQILESLTVNQRVCMVLKHIEEMTCNEIADVLKTNVNTVKTRLKRAREHILAQRVESKKEAITNEM